MITAAFNAGEASQRAFDSARASMATLNRAVHETARKYRVTAQADVTGFGFLGHLSEMTSDGISIAVNAAAIPYIPEALCLAADFMTTSAGDASRQFFGTGISHNVTNEPLIGVMYDPQTSGGLLIAVHPDDADKLLHDLQALEQPSAIAAEAIVSESYCIVIK